MKFEVIGPIHNVETIASGSGIRILARLTRLYGKGHWRKLKGLALVRLGDGGSAKRSFIGSRPMALGNV
jgi:hypothetical protein